MSDSSMEYVKNSIIEVLQQGDRLLQEVTDETYTRCVPEVFNASIGGHYRHCLEHFEALLGDEALTVVDYDARMRNQALEKDRHRALSRTRTLIRLIDISMDDETLSRPVGVRCKVSYRQEESPLVTSTLAREAMYVIAHAIHHYAIMASICNLLGVKLPDDFGIAPSTRDHEKSVTELSSRQ